MRSKLTYSNVVSTICLFLLLGGGAAFAASQLPKNSVGTKQIKKNAVNSSKVKDHSLTGKDINLAKLGTVPSASQATVADGLAPVEATHLVGSPGEPPFENGSGNAPPEEGLTPLPVGFYKDHEGIVHLQGVATNPTGEVTIFTLPPGYRPASGRTDVFVQAGSGGVLVAGPNVSISGKDRSNTVIAIGKFTLLDGVTFRAES